MRIPLAQLLGNRSSNTSDDGKTVNAFFETQGNIRWVVKRPGLSTLVISPSLATSSAQGFFSFNSKLYAAVGNSLYEIVVGAGGGTVTITPATRTLNKFLLNQYTLG